MHKGISTAAAERLNMPTRYGDKKVFRVKGSDEFYEVCFKVERKEATALSLVNQKEIDRNFLDKIQTLFNEIKELPPETKLMESRIENVQPVVHAVDTSQAAIPNSKKWTQNLHDAYTMLSRFPDGLTDEESQDRFAVTQGLDRRDIGNSWRPARHALAKIGLIRQTGEKRQVRSGRNANVWIVADNTWTPPSINTKLTKEQIEEFVGRSKND